MGYAKPLHEKLLKAFKGNTHKSKAWKKGVFDAHSKISLDDNSRCYCPNDCSTCAYEAGHRHYRSVNNILHTF